MKKYYFLAAALLVMASACQKNSGDSASYIPQPAEDAHVAIQFGTNIHTNDVKAPVDAWAKQDLYVFGYERVPYTAATPASLQNAYIDCVKAKAPSSGTSGSIELLDADGQPFYYGYKNNAYIAYDFYGCYFADAASAAKVEKSEKTISVPFTINGTQDLMVAYADREADTDNGSIVPVEYAYSGYSARFHDERQLAVVPNLKFQHSLTRFDFTIQDCSTTGTVINIDAFSISSIAEGNLVVADIAGNPTGVVTSASAQTEDLAVSLPRGGLALKPGESAQSVGSMMVIPAKSHTLKIKFKQLVDASVPGVYKDGLDVSHVITPADVVEPGHTQAGSATEFKVGSKYNVLVKIYGLEKIEITVSLEPWSDGGSIVIDPDDNPWGNN